ncbi:MAG: hypothetical protein ACOX1S_05000 [Anaerostipes sp.]|nr:hypothetical protein [Anaerostipes sp.]
MSESDARVQVIETEHYTKGNKPRDIKGVLVAIGILLILILLTALVIPTANRFILHEEALYTLREAKTISLAVRNSAYEFEAKGKPVVSKTEDSGLNPDMIKNIMELTDAKGIIEYVKFDENKREVLKLRYKKDHILVTYEKPEENKAKGWNVYELKDIVTD